MFTERTYQLEGEGIDAILKDEDGTSLLRVNYGGLETEASAGLSSLADIVKQDYEISVTFVDPDTEEVLYEATAVTVTDDDQIFGKTDFRLEVTRTEDDTAVVTAETLDGGDRVGLSDGSGNQYAVVDEHQFSGTVVGDSLLPVGLTAYEPDHVGDEDYRIAWTERGLFEMLSEDTLNVGISVDSPETAVIGFLAATVVLNIQKWRTDNTHS